MTFVDPETEAFYRELESMYDPPTEAEATAFVESFVRELETIAATPSIPIDVRYADYFATLRGNALSVA